jgi:hypothetical protein
MTKERIQAQKLFRPFVGKYFKRLNKGSYEYEWFCIVNIPSSRLYIYSPVLGYDFDEYIVPVKFMQLDGMLREGTISISPNDFQNNGTKMPCNVIEITADEWFDEQKRRIQEDTDRRLNQIKNNK